MLNVLTCTLMMEKLMLINFVKNFMYSQMWILTILQNMYFKKNVAFVFYEGDNEAVESQLFAR